MKKVLALISLILIAAIGCGTPTLEQKEAMFLVDWSHQSIIHSSAFVDVIDDGTMVYGVTVNASSGDDDALEPFFSAVGCVARVARETDTDGELFVFFNYSVVSIPVEDCVTALDMYEADDDGMVDFIMGCTEEEDY